MRVVIVGCGLGGLSCAIACRQADIDVTVLERAPQLLPASAIGAGIQVPPNAARVLKHFGLDTALSQHGGVTVDERVLRRWEDGRILARRPGGEAMIQDFGMPYHVIHRADYLDLCVNKATSLGVKLRTGAEVANVSTEGPPVVTLVGGEEIEADVVVGADGLWSTMRERVLKEQTTPRPTGDLAYRGTFSREQFKALQDPRIDALMEDTKAQLWMGPDKHCTFYPVRGGREFNLVLLCPDDLPEDARSAAGEVEEVRQIFKGWDPVLQSMISCMPSVLKWKLLHMKELGRWVTGNIALLGDACHPSLPYQAQGAAMAVEDGCCLGILLGHVAERQGNGEEWEKLVTPILQLYESLRKSRTTMNVEGSAGNRTMFHMPDGPDQRARDEALAKINWKDPCVWHWGDPEYMTELYGFDVVASTEDAFRGWKEDRAA